MEHRAEQIGTGSWHAKGKETLYIANPVNTAKLYFMDTISGRLANVRRTQIQASHICYGVADPS